MNHLKRYCITYIALIFISIIIIGFYLTNSKVIDFNWRTVSGDEEVVKDAVIFGTGENYNTMMPQPFYLSKDEAERIELPRGYFGWFYQDTQIDKYIQEYRSFMRGKDPWTENFVETDGQLIYVDEKNLSWENNESNKLGIEILDKETKEVTAFEIPVPEQESKIYGVRSVVASKDKLFVQSFMERQQGQVYSDEDVILIIDLNRQAIEDIRFPEKDIEQKSGMYTDLNYQDSGLIGGEMNYLYIYEQYKVDEYGAYEEDSPNEYQLQIYNADTDQTKTIPLEKGYLYEGDFLQIYDNAVYRGMLQGEHYTLMRWDASLEEKEIIFDENVSNGDMEMGQGDSYPLAAIHNGRFYMIFPALSAQTAADISINAFDLQTGENIYQGIIKAGGSIAQYQYLDLYQLEFKEE